MGLTSTQTIIVLKEIGKTIEDNKTLLTELDGAIGDGDHGINMNKGFAAVTKKLDNMESEDIGDIFKTVGMTLVVNVGGASGPLYGTAFMKAAAVVSGKQEIDINDFIKIMDEAIQGIKMRGKAVPGDKTMLDALEPAYNALICAVKEKLTTVDALEKVKEAAFEGAKYTKKIAAKKGRASYLGDRSIGHQDPGATSSYLIINTIYETVKKLKD
ncbi:MAG: dihydroxyacetone kinase subunit DhaL [Bacillota bacterium]